MKIAVYGATGMVGSQVVAEALTRGHETTAVSRQGTPVEGASMVTADLSDRDTFRRLGAEHDVVVVSVPPSRTGEPHESYIEAHRSLIETGIPARLFVVGGAGALEVDGVRLADTPGFPGDYKPEAFTMGTVLELYREAPQELDWTMLAPAPGIAPGERTGQYKVGQDAPVGDTISSQDFAVAILDELENPQHRGTRFTVAN